MDRELEFDLILELVKRGFASELCSDASFTWKHYDYAIEHGIEAHWFGFWKYQTDHGGHGPDDAIFYNDKLHINEIINRCGGKYPSLLIRSREDLSVEHLLEHRCIIDNGAKDCVFSWCFKKERRSFFSNELLMLRDKRHMEFGFSTNPLFTPELVRKHRYLRGNIADNPHLSWKELVANLDLVDYKSMSRPKKSVALF